MKVAAFNGSARREGNTHLMIQHVFRALEEAGIETEEVHLNGTPLRGCTACYKCYERKDRRCAVEGDPVNDWIRKMDAADGIILASPTYFADVSAEMKVLIDRAGMVARANGDMHRRKVGAAVVAVRRGGSIHAFDTMNHFFLIGQVVIPGSVYWNMGMGRGPGDVESDKEGIRTMEVLGQNMAWALQRLR